MASSKTEPPARPDFGTRARAFATGIGAFLVGFAGATVFWLADMPLAWMLGSMTAAAIASMAGLSWQINRSARDVSRPVIGVLAGSSFTPAIFAHIGDWAGMLLVVIVFGVVTTLIGYVIAWRGFGFDKPTAFFASTPAGLTEMSLLGDQLGGDLRSLFLIHSIRVVAVVFCIPLILEVITGTDIGAGMGPGHAPPGSGEAQDWAILGMCGAGGYLLSRLLPIPAGVMIYSLALSAIIHLYGATSAAPPAWLVIGVQVVIGSIAGARFRGIRWREAGKTVAFGLFWAFSVIGAAVAVAFAISSVTALGVSGTLVSIAPGGMAEMTLLTYALGIDVAFVVACQVLRNVSTVIIAPMVYRLLSK